MVRKQKRQERSLHSRTKHPSMIQKNHLVLKAKEITRKKAKVAASQGFKNINGILHTPTIVDKGKNYEKLLNRINSHGNQEFLSATKEFAPKEKKEKEEISQPCTPSSKNEKVPKLDTTGAKKSVAKQLREAVSGTYENSFGGHQSERNKQGGASKTLTPQCLPKSIPDTPTSAKKEGTVSGFFQKIQHKIDDEKPNYHPTIKTFEIKYTKYNQKNMEKIERMLGTNQKFFHKKAEKHPKKHQKKTHAEPKNKGEKPSSKQNIEDDSTIPTIGSSSSKHEEQRKSTQLSLEKTISCSHKTSDTKKHAPVLAKAGTNSGNGPQVSVHHDYNINNVHKIIDFLGKDEELSKKKENLNKRLRDLRHFDPHHEENHQGSKEHPNKKGTGTNEGHFLAKGTQIENYVVGKIIGQGSYAIVQLGEEKDTGKKVAIKTYEKIKLLDSYKMRNVNREIESLKILSHPFIISLLTQINTGKHIHLVMEYIGSDNLGSIVYQSESNSLPVEICQKIMRKVIEGLAFAHSKGIVHRDVKMENVVLGPDLSRLELRLIDFGFSIRTGKNAKLTVFCGTPSYMAPEIVSRTPYFGFPADVWALGVMFYRIAAGKFPFSGTSDKELFSAIKSGKFQTPEHFPEKLVDLIGGMLRVNCKERLTCAQVTPSF